MSIAAAVVALLDLFLLQVLLQDKSSGLDAPYVHSGGLRTLEVLQVLQHRSGLFASHLKWRREEAAAAGEAPHVFPTLMVTLLRAQVRAPEQLAADHHHAYAVCFAALASDTLLRPPACALIPADFANYFCT